MSYEIRATPNGEGIPRVQRVMQGPLPRPGEIWNWQPKWQVVFPDEWEWDCCRQTDTRTFDFYAHALYYALNRIWEMEREYGRL